MCGCQKKNDLCKVNMWWNKTQTIELSITLNVGWHLQNREFKIKGQCDQDLAPTLVTLAKNG